MPLRKVGDCALDECRTRGGGGEVGMEELTIDEAGGMVLETEAAPAPQDVNGLLTMCVSDDGDGVDGEADAETVFGAIDEV